jgi:alpha-tubulin suppressor-like RCC1 family protein
MHKNLFKNLFFLLMPTLLWNCKNITISNHNTGKFSSIMVGADHSCASTITGHLYCWGRNAFGEVGNNTDTQTAIPVAVQSNAGFGTVTSVSVSLGAGSTCAISSNNAYCWGNNTDGQLGIGTIHNVSLPTQVSGSNGFANPTSISIGANHACAIAANNRPFCWGFNAYGQLGDNTQNNTQAPVAVSQTVMTYATEIVAGEEHSCALGNGAVYCWGQNQEGQLGNGTQVDALTPVPVSTGTGLGVVSTIAGGYRHNCAISNGNAYCWGLNDDGQLGDGTHNTSLTPIMVNQVNGFSNPTSIVAGYEYTCAIADGGKVYCWGDNQYGQLGDGTYTSSDVPVLVSAPTGVSVATSISVDYNHTCAVYSNIAYCWGNNNHGQLGNNTTTNSNIPVLVNDSIY